MDACKFFFWISRVSNAIDNYTDAYNGKHQIPVDDFFEPFQLLSIEFIIKLKLFSFRVFESFFYGHFKWEMFIPRWNDTSSTWCESTKITIPWISAHNGIIRFQCQCKCKYRLIVCACVNLFSSVHRSTKKMTHIINPTE